MIHAPVRPAFGVVANRAGIENDDVGLLGRSRNAVAGGDGAFGDVARVGLIHLAAEGLDIDPGHVGPVRLRSERKLPCLPQLPLQSSAVRTSARARSSTGSSAGAWRSSRIRPASRATVSTPSAIGGAASSAWSIPPASI